ncbi:MAG: twin-arginine translocase subunit TatC [Bacteroidales bacterium]|nr:twin-arginine translocase subunit TatC [Bacteroidales bacterium]
MAEERLDESKDMSFWDHLEALRQGLFHIVIALLAAFVVLFFFKGFLFDELILAPTRSDFFFYRWFGMQTGLQLVNIELSTQFMVHMRVTFMCAIILCCPYILFEIWRFIAPALYRHEKRATRRAFLFASFLFYLGIAVGYSIILPLMVNFFDGYKVSEEVVNTISLNSYISTVNSTVLLFGIVFEIPTLVALLSQIGLLTRQTLIGGWKWAVLVIAVLAAVITPADPFSMLIAAIPLALLYGLSILVCRKGETESEDEAEGAGKEEAAV